MSYKKNTQVEVLPVVDLSKKSAIDFFFVGGAIQVVSKKRVVIFAGFLRPL